MQLVFETHSLSEDNDRGVATGWLPGRLSERGRALASELGDRRRDDGFAVVVSSDLRRAVETVEIAFAGYDHPPVLFDSTWKIRDEVGEYTDSLNDSAKATSSRIFLVDWRLRECDYGALNGHPAAEVHGAVTGIDERFPGGESWREAVTRCSSALADLEARWADDRVLVVGHMATYWALQHRYAGMPLEALGRGFVWQEGWSFEALGKTG